MGLLSQIVEAERANAASDSKFWQSLLYYFELRVPAAVSQGNPAPYLYPLVLPPEALRMSEPFTVTSTPSNGGGLFLEEQGIVSRQITISGTTGWAPRRLAKLVSNFSSLGFPANKSFSRNNATSSNILLALSGQRHFQFLQDTVFRTYADLKQDPATADGTELYFHNVKDDEHWRVVPMSFNLTREAGKPLDYRYDVTMLAVQSTTVVDVAFSEDQGVLNTLKDSYRVLRSGISVIRAALQDLGGVEGELRAFNGGFVSLLDGAVSIADATEDLVSGAATLIQQPFNLVENTIKAGLDALLELETGERQTTALGAPANLLEDVRQIVDGLAMIGSYPSAFRNNVQAAVDRYQQRQSLAASGRSSEMEQASTNAPPQTTRGFSSQALGTALMPGDSLRANGDLGLGSFLPRFTSAVEYVLAEGDTLPGLAARFLKDARSWKYIAIFNDLQPPFLSADGLPGTLAPGDKILIPGFATPANVQTNQLIFGVRSDEPAAVHALGRDLLLAPVPGTDLFDLVIDDNHGAVDVQTVEGVDNLKQALRTRIITERGTDLLYRGLGASRIVGLGVAAVDIETARFRLVEAVQADPRVVAVRSLSLQVTPTPDSVVADLSVEVRSFTRPERITVTTPAA